MNSKMSLDMAITHAYENPEKSIVEVYSLICLSAIDDITVFVPVVGRSSLSWEYSLIEDAQDFLLTDVDGTVWFPVFTDPSNFERNDTSIQLLPAKLRNILLYVCNLKNASGLVFNPYSLRMLLSKRIIRILLQVILVTITSGDVQPDENKNYF